MSALVPVNKWQKRQKVPAVAQLPEAALHSPAQTAETAQTSRTQQKRASDASTILTAETAETAQTSLPVTPALLSFGPNSADDVAQDLRVRIRTGYQLE
jgi:hypothetical protein